MALIRPPPAPSPALRPCPRILPDKRQRGGFMYLGLLTLLGLTVKSAIALGL